jgi:hypothetical protein
MHIRRRHRTSPASANESPIKIHPFSVSVQVRIDNVVVTT